MHYRFHLNFRAPIELTAAEAELDRVEPSWAKFAVFLRTGFRFGAKDGQHKPRTLLAVRQRLDVYRQRAESGNTLALLHAVQECADEGLPLPEWLAEKFSAQLALFLKPGGASSLDDVYCSPNLPTRGNAAKTARRDWRIGVQLWLDLTDIQRAEPSLSFHAALKKLLLSGRYGVGKTKASRLIETVKKNQNELLGKRQSIPQIRAKRRKP